MASPGEERAGAAPGAPPEPRELIRRYRAGTSVRALATEFGVSFDWVARRVIDAGTRRRQPPRGTRRRPAELDSDRWLSQQLASGAGVGDLSRRLHVTRSTVRNALRRYAARRAEGGGAGEAVGASDPERRFAAATERVEQATAALERARRVQTSAVSELQEAGLTIAAIADRLGTDEHVVESLLAAEHPVDGA
jgi:lambda repressor-like predicted transcriptional regulator